MGKKYTTQNNSTNTSEITHNHTQKQSMTVDHTLVLLFIDQSIAITWTRPNLCKSNFRIIAHALTFKTRKWLHNRQRKEVARVTTVDVDVVLTTLPHGPD